MRKTRSLGFDDLEARKLLTKVHHAALHVAPVLASSSPAEVLALDGTLVANNKAATILTDGYGDQTTATPVSGVLAGLGMVHGTWDETVDGNGKYLGPDEIQLHTSKGSFIVAFDATTLGQGAPTAQGMVYNGAAVEVVDGTGAYAKASATGFIQENTNAKQTVIESLALNNGSST
jgi:hypothetical protein